MLRTISIALVIAIAAPAAADDRVDLTTTLYQERHQDSKGLTVVHPQLSLGADLGALGSRLQPLCPDLVRARLAMLSSPATAEARAGGASTPALA